ncbi:uncharacterized protein HMPREF1541_02023 [Cyphellophora europaea CBS 101466]|uniref:1,3-beta-glucanosyltransferase n=1 Tax=Cyphellophora europaea (strain CBS 101466) TaxID=1220924 RepID=W2S2R8_CYPE1|nr:uncharacterized protein HMPREF1541_02023 [Cyphellophora europaea CBS 101466]ETN42865.1 hypothetical protein HMPREF1541_02023 [Cyphellophora europaea CBS 101466]
MSAESTPALTIQHNRFLLNGKPLLFRGVVYQIPFRSRAIIKPSTLPPKERYTDRDPLNDARLAELERDVELFRELGINAIWVYTVCLNVSHDRCMKLLSDNGIYVFVGCSAPGVGESVNRLTPHGSYSRSLLDRYYGVVDAFAGYDNLAGFSVADHVVNNAQATKAAEVIKALVRDVKGYMRARTEKTGGRTVPVGLVDEEWAATQVPSFDYYMSGSPEERVDFYALVNFSWGLGKLQGEVKEDILVRKFSGSKVPILVAEYGANTERPRTFEETKVLYGERLCQIFSGGFAYEFFEAANRYGLVKDNGGDLTRLEDFEQYRRRLQETAGADRGLMTPGPDATEGGEALFPSVSENWLAISTLPSRPL